MDHEEYHLIEDAFITGFREARDRLGFLRLANIPMEIDHPEMAGLKLIEVRLEDDFKVGAAAPGFASRELVYQPLPGAMIDCRTALRFVYVSLEGRKELTLGEVLALRDGREPADMAAETHPAPHHHHHHHHH